MSTQLRGHDGIVAMFSIRRDGTLASSATDGTVRVWDLERGKERIVLDRPDGDVYGMSWMWGDHIGSGWELNGWLQWDTATGQRIDKPVSLDERVFAAAALPQGWTALTHFGVGQLFNSKRQYLDYQHHFVTTLRVFQPRRRLDEPPDREDQTIPRSHRLGPVQAPGPAIQFRQAQTTRAQDALPVQVPRRARD